MKMQSVLKVISILIITLVYLNPNQTFAKFTKGENIKLDTSWLVGNVLLEAQALTKELKRDIIVYSWVDRKYIKGFESGQINVIDTTLINNAIDNATDRMSGFWNSSLNSPVTGRSGAGGAMAPNGLYVATEPVISQTYGNVVYRMILPKGTKYIDGRYRTNPKLGPNLQTALLTRGCTNPLAVTKENPVFAARNLIKSDTNQTACRQVLAEIADAVGAKAVQYIFKTEPVPFCNKTYDWNSAFVLIDETVFKNGSFQPLVRGQSNPSDGLEQERELINAVFANAGQPPQFPRSIVASQDEAKKYMSENYFACNPAINEK